MPWMKASEWAATHTNKFGKPWTVQYANRRIQECGIPRRSDQKIDSVVADAMHAGQALPVESIPVPADKALPSAPEPAIEIPQGNVATLPKADLERLEIIEDLRRKRLKNDADEEKLLNEAEVERTWERHIDAIKNRLLLIEAKVPLECSAIVAKEVRSALRELSEYNPDAA